MNNTRAFDIIGKILAFALLALIPFLLWVFAANLLEADANIKTSVIGFIGAIAVASFTHYQTKKREISSRHFANKRESYMEFIDLIFEMMKATKENRVTSQKKMIDKMFAFKKSLMVWGGPEVIAEWNSFELKANKQQSVTETMQIFENILRAIRKDLGHDDNALPPGSLVALIIVSEEKKMVLDER